ncbi:MAG: hypothetical protein ABI743_00215, partial [bacterium]
MRTTFRWLPGLIALTAIGCSSSHPPTLPAPAGDGSAVPPAAVSQFAGSVPSALGTPVQRTDLATSALAIYTVDIDPAGLQATAHLKETRQGQANDDLYLLPVDSFLKPGDFQVTGVSGDATNILIRYQVSHPFPAPSDPTGTPNGSTNRADLGVSGMVLLL